MESKASVIIPTIWRSPYLRFLLMVLQKEERVDDIILIDNAPKDRKFDINNYSKVLLVEEETNTYVNPAWNKGVDLVKNEQIIICNDDLVADVAVMLEAFQKIECDFLGLSHSSWTGKGFEEGKLHEGHCIGKGWGCLFTFKKKSWKPIPEDLKIYSGDRYLAQGSVTYQVDVPIVGSIGKSSKSREMESIRQLDMKTFAEKYKI